MFPNVRLMIVAMIASIVVLGCGFGVFAAFRVNHEPLVRLATGTAPIELVFGSAAPPALTLAAGETPGTRFEISKAQIAGVAAASPAPELDRQSAVEPPSPVASPVAVAEPDAAQSEQSAAIVPPPETAPAAKQAPETETAAKQDGAADTSSEPPPAAVSDTAAIEPPADQPPPVDQATQETKPETAAAAAASPAKVRRTMTRKAVSRRRLAARAIAQSDAQNATFPQPIFQSAFQPAPQAVQRQLAVKQHRATQLAKKTVAATTAVGGPFVSPPAQ